MKSEALRTIPACTHRVDEHKSRDHGVYGELESLQWRFCGYFQSFQWRSLHSCLALANGTTLSETEVMHNEQRTPRFRFKGHFNPM
jgi:hypothetical protein